MFNFGFGYFSLDVIMALLASMGITIIDPPVDPNPVAGTVIEEYCVGTTLTTETADGEGGIILTSVEESTQCGYIPPPVAGTVLDSYCVGTTKYTVTADGEGGSTITSRADSESCGYVPPENPPYGTLLNEGCSSGYPGVKWELYADGEGGTYTVKEVDSPECGWEPPNLQLSSEQNEGDRFRPVIVDVEYTNWLGEDEPWGIEHASTDIGWFERRGSQIYVWGDGRIGTGTLTLGNQDILFYMEEEPVCENERESNGSTVDCQGYRVASNTRPFIYYGDDNEFVMPWEYTVLEYIRHTDGFDPAEGIDPDGWAEVGDSRWNKWQKKVDDMNELLQRSGVFITIQLVGVGQAHYHGLRNLESISKGLETDLVIGWGVSNEGTCGIAYPNTRFYKGEPVVGMSRCGFKTDLHELGHAVGLAHGPENQAYASNGYIFPDFGHGYNDYCGQYDDIMSYGYNDEGFGNSRQICDDQYPDYGSVRGDDPAGHRDYHDSAYHLNRVRFDVGLIHPEFDYVNTEQQPAAKAEKVERPFRPLIED